MLKKYKILMFLIVLVLFGIITVMSFWLYGIYKSKQEVLVSEVERSLFNTIQSYYKVHVDPDKFARSHRERGDAFINEVIKLYPHADKKRIQNVWDSISKERFNHYTMKHQNRKQENRNEANEILPPFMMRYLDLNDQKLGLISAMLDTALVAKNVGVAVSLDLVGEDQAQKMRRKRFEILPDGRLGTRAMLINQERNEFLRAYIHKPFFFIVQKMAPQLITSLALLLALVSSFVYLLWTINRQNKAALLRKSFVNNMTHELKTPVATVMAAIEALQRYGSRSDEARREKYLNISHRELNHLSGMIERVLQLDMDEVNGIVLDKTDFNVNHLLQECIETISLSSTKEISIDLKTSEENVLLYGDASHMKNVFSNLLDNAVKYSGDDVRVHIKLNNTKQAVVITFQDYGQGIAPEYLKDIFDMFFRVPKGHLYSVKGFGLGLSYVKQIVEKHNGQVEVQSKLEEGTVFKIILPHTRLV